MNDSNDPLSELHGLTSRASAGRPQKEAIAINERIRRQAQSMLTPWDRSEEFKTVMTANADPSFLPHGEDDV